MTLRTTALVCLVCSLWAGYVHAQEACPSYPPVTEVTGVRWYKDTKSSVVDAEKAAENLRLQRDIRKFTDGLSSRLDRVIEGESKVYVRACVRGNLEAWAAGGALLKTPTWAVPIAEQTKTMVALGFILIKLKAIEGSVPERVRAWQRQSLVALLKAFPPQVRDSNLYLWSAVATAAADLVEHDEILRQYHDGAWQFAISAIAADGAVAAEMARGQRALIYHTFFYNAASALLKLRDALGIPSRPGDLAALARLTALLGRASCDPSDLARRAGANQEGLDPWNKAMAAEFGAKINTPDWSRCARAPDKFPGAGWGGRFDLTVKAMEMIGRN